MILSYSYPAVLATRFSRAIQHIKLLQLLTVFASLAGIPGLSALTAVANTNDPFALEEDWSGFYVGAGAGYANVYSWEDDDDDDDFDFDTDYGDGDLGFIISGGYRFNPYLAAEVAYSDSGTLEWDDSNIFVDDLGDVYDVDARIDVTSWQFSALGILPFLQVWEVYARGGVVLWDADSDQTLVSRVGDPTIRRSIDDDGVDFLLGFGAGRIFRDRLLMRLEYTTHRIDDDLLELESGDDANTDMWSLQLHYRFGASGDATMGGGKIDRPQASSR